MEPVIILIIALVVATLVFGIILKIKFTQTTRRKPDDKYNDFHLGEMTSRDIPGKLKEHEQAYARWYSRQKNKSGVNKPRVEGDKKWNRK